MIQIVIAEQDFLEVFGLLELLVISLDRIGSSELSRRESNETVGRFVDEADITRRLLRARRLLSDALDSSATREQIEAVDHAMERVRPWDHRPHAPDAASAHTWVCDDAIALMKAFAQGSIDVHRFATDYHSLWRALRDSGRLGNETGFVRRALDFVFTAIDDAENPSKGTTLDNQTSALRLQVLAALHICDAI
jgi:hypothetical protein